MLTPREDLYTTGSVRYVDACTNGTSLLGVTSTPDFRKYDIYTLNQSNTSLTVLSTPSGICLATAATAVITSSGVAQVDLIDINTNARTNISSGSVTTYTNSSGQQVDAQPSTGMAVSTRNSNGSVQVINANTGTATTVSPSGLSGAQASCILARPATSSFLCGTNNGKVIEIDTGGSTYKTITLPTTPNVGTAPVQVVSGLAMSGDRLAVVTHFGILYIYQYSTSTLIYSGIVNGGDSTSQMSTLARSSSGTTLIGHGETPSFVPTAITEMFFDATQPNFESTFYNELNGSIPAVGMDPTTNITWLVFNSTGNFITLRTFNGPSVNKVSDTTRIQSSGVDVTGRILRIRDAGIGRSCIELDNNVTAGVNSLTVTDNTNYIELALTSAPEKGDIRGVTT